MKTLHEELLEQASHKPIRKFLQFDVYQRVYLGDDDTPRDDDGDSLWSCETFELKSISELRVLVPVNRTAEEIIRGLKKVIECIENDPSGIAFDLDPSTQREKYLLDAVAMKIERVFAEQDAQDPDGDAFPF